MRLALPVRAIPINATSFLTIPSTSFDNSWPGVKYGDVKTTPRGLLLEMWTADGLDEVGVARKSDINQRYFVFDDSQHQFRQLLAGGEIWGRENHATGIAFGDVDGDGLDEVGVARKSDINHRYFIFDDSQRQFRQLKAGGETWGRENYATSIAFGDVDADGRDEIGIARKSSINHRYFVVDDAIDRFVLIEASGTNWGEDRYATSIGFGDIDGDGDDDLGVARKSERDMRFSVLQLRWRRVPAGDFNQDGSLDVADLDLLYAAIADGVREARFDLTGDDHINEADTSFWIREISRTRPGDTNLDGRVEFVDFPVLAGNFGRPVDSWAAGDFTGDGVVGFEDFLLLSDAFGYDRLNSGASGTSKSLGSSAIPRDA